MTLQPSSTPLTAFKVLSFDVYGTLIDWETGIHNALIASAPIAQLPADHDLKDRTKLLEAFAQREGNIQTAHPSLEYAALLAAVYRALIHDYAVPFPQEVDSAAATFGNSVGAWPAFPDTVSALQRLQKHYTLIALTNSSPRTVGASIAGPLAPFVFSAVYTAADIGSYKPDARNFAYLLQHAQQAFGAAKMEILHVAQSLYHDHEPAARAGMLSCWVERGGAVMGLVDGESTMARFAWRVGSLGELADLVEESWRS